MSRFNTPIKGKKNEKGLMQIEVFPQRVLNLDTAQKLIDVLNEIDGITRMVVFGPRRPREDVEDLLDGKYVPTDKKYLNIKGEMVELTVQVGRFWIEINDESVIEKVRAAAKKVLPFPFEMYEGLYIRSQQTVVDYAKGVKTGDAKLGLFDPKDRRGHSCCGTKAPVTKVAAAAKVVASTKVVAKAPVKVVAKAPVKVVAKAPAKKVVAKAPVKVVAKAPAKKVVAKAPVKAASKAPAKKVVAKAPAKKVVAKAPVKAASKAPVKAASKAPAKKVVAKAPAKKVVAKAPASKAPAKKAGARKASN